MRAFYTLKVSYLSPLVGTAFNWERNDDINLSYFEVIKSTLKNFPLLANLSTICTEMVTARWPFAYYAALLRDLLYNSLRKKT